MSIEEFRKKWDDSSLKTPLALVLEAGLRSVRRDAESYGEEAGATLRAAAMVSRDLMELPWTEIRYIFKRLL